MRRFPGIKCQASNPKTWTFPVFRNLWSLVSWSANVSVSFRLQFCYCSPHPPGFLPCTCSAIQHCKSKILFEPRSVLFSMWIAPASKRCHFSCWFLQMHGAWIPSWILKRMWFPKQQELKFTGLSVMEVLTGGKLNNYCLRLCTNDSCSSPMWISFCLRLRLRFDDVYSSGGLFFWFFWSVFAQGGKDFLVAVNSCHTNPF